MGLAHFIARRILIDSERQDRLSRPIVIIAVLGIVIGMAVMILTVGISTGFQGEVRAKVTGAGAHIEIGPLAQSDPNASTRVRIAQPFYPWLDTVAGVAHIQVFALQPGIVETERDIQGVLAKGVGADHDWEFLRKHLVQGTVLAIGDSTRSQVLISQWMAKRLQRKLGDELTVYMIKGRDEIRPRKYTITGIYETGLEKVDHQVIYLDIAHVQRFAQWGVQAEIRVEEQTDGPGISVEGLGFGGDGRFTYEWPGMPWHGKGPHTICTTQDSTVMLVLHDNGGALPDTAWLTIRPGPGTGPCATASTATFLRRGSGGSYKDYCGGFEVILKDHRDLVAMDDLIYREYLGPGLRTVTVRQQYPEIFAWLELLDTNVVVVILLMVIVAMINMASALLIIILERTNMIGVLKALGAGNRVIRKIFLIDAAYIMGIGILLGDAMGIGLAYLQQRLGLVRLPVESYYVDQVPVQLSFWPILALNLGVLAVCVLALTVPSMYVSRIAPARAIRFE